MYSSPTKKMKSNMIYSVSLEALPEDIRVEIFSKVAADSVRELHNLKLVSKMFERLCDDPFVLRRAAIRGDPFYTYFPVFADWLGHVSFLWKCNRFGNPVEIFRRGFVKYCTEVDEIGGLQRIAVFANAANAGVEEARYFYGIILVCLGGESKREGFELLASCRKTLVEYSKNWNESNLGFYTSGLWYKAARVVKLLRDSYVRDKCNCDGLKEDLYESPTTYLEFPRRHSGQLPASFSCQICWCHKVVQHFLDVTEE